MFERLIIIKRSLLLAVIIYWFDWWLEWCNRWTLLFNWFRCSLKKKTKPKIMTEKDESSPDEDEDENLTEEERGKSLFSQ